MFKFWLQSFLVGTPTIVVGFRDDDGTASKHQAFETLRLPRLGKGWDPRVALHFADEVLTWLDAALAAAWDDDDDNATFVVRYEPSTREVHLMPEEPSGDAKRRRR